ncbi:LytTR family DNA-binding domain-containing protein [uncultured Solobacterium sp.]|uniref:LytR/AlgR family response regulator transcription factor n=1 Tax=uncultured Solobacterium sp. TaxID=747375 RepID=UPI0028DC15E6|nr:LytTR family DNA-binding domain-containing protein [uncultured Solobacterium sp.]
MHILFCDGEKEDIEKYKIIAVEIAKNINIPLEIHTCTSAAEVLLNIEDYGAFVDVLFLDIGMVSGKNGMEVSKELRKQYHFAGEIVFITKSEKYVFDAFDVNASGYIVKNKTSDSRIKEVIGMAICNAQEKKKEYLLLKGSGEYRNIALSDIFAFEAKNNRIIVYYGDKQKFEFYSSLDKMQNTLLIYRIIRVHRSFLVSVDKIVGYSYQEGLCLANNMQIPVGRKYRSNVKTLLHL